MTAPTISPATTAVVPSKTIALTTPPPAPPGNPTAEKKVDLVAKFTLSDRQTLSLKASDITKTPILLNLVPDGSVSIKMDSIFNLLKTKFGIDVPADPGSGPLHSLYALTITFKRFTVGTDGSLDLDLVVSAPWPIVGSFSFDSVELSVVLPPSGNNGSGTDGNDANGGANNGGTKS